MTLLIVSEENENPIVINGKEGVYLLMYLKIPGLASG